jgi:hypothetical protein
MRMAWTDRMKALKDGSAKIVAAITHASTKTDTLQRSRDPWYSNAAHVREVNDNSRRGRPRWIPRRRNWI